MPLELHHITPLRDPKGNGRHNNPENLETLCHDCHAAWHNTAEGLMTYREWLQRPLELDNQLCQEYRRMAKRRYNRLKRNERKLRVQELLLERQLQGAN